MFHQTLDFDTCSDEEFERIFLNILNHSSKDNTYKFAFARFLLDYSNHTETPDPHVDFATIASYFLRYYWTQICKLKMKHAPQTKKKPVIVTIIEKRFGKQYYPQTFEEIKKQEPKKIQKCKYDIVSQCFHDVIWRFQKIRVNRATETKLLFDYEIDRVKNPNRKYINLEYGINLNPAAINFFKRYYAVLLKAVILEWARFLENLNVGLPKIINKTEGKNSKRRSLTNYRKILNPFFGECFYCNIPLQDRNDVHVEHVIPFDYIAEDNIWNLTLVCKKCNLTKLGALPPKKYIKKLIQRNNDYRGKIPRLEKALLQLDSDFERVIKNHYNNAKSHGYMPLKSFP